MLPDREDRDRVKRDADLLAAAAQTVRFGQLRLAFYRSELLPEKQSQFAAVTWLLPDKSAVITYRGTDLTLTGWKEDFNMSFQPQVPAQEKALWYLEAFARVHSGPIRLAGHSKGGNLAVYAAAFCDKRLQKRIRYVFSHDGPGFLRQVLDSPGFAAVSLRIRKTVPQSSVIGMLLEHQEQAKIVKSRTVSLLQHDPFTWEVKDNAFTVVDHLTSDARYVDRTLSAWLEQMSPDKRERFVDALFGILETTDLQTFDQLRSDWQKTLPAVARQVVHLDADTRDFLLRALKELAALSLKAIPQTVRETVHGKKES